MAGPVLTFEKLPTNDERRRLFKGILNSGLPNDAPCYLAVWQFDDESVPVARIRRESMSGGINLWGSRYRWTIDRASGKRDYADTLRDAKEIVARGVFELLREKLDGVTP